MEILEKDKYYHIYNRGNNRENIFKNDENRRYFLSLYQRHLNSHVSTFAYCLLNNHFHLLIRIENKPETVTQAFSNLFNAYAKAFNKAYDRTGSLFQKNFKRKWVNDEKYLKQLILYIHMNPELHFRTDFMEYQFSSYQKILSKEDPILETIEVLGLFGDRTNYIKTHQDRNYEIKEKYLLE